MRKSIEDSRNSSTGTYRRCITERCRRYRCGYCGDEKCWNKAVKLESWRRDIASRKFYGYNSICEKNEMDQIYKGKWKIEWNHIIIAR